MRIVSQDGLVDLNYNSISLQVKGGIILAVDNIGMTPIGIYENQKQALNVLSEIHRKYESINNNFIVKLPTQEGCNGW